MNFVILNAGQGYRTKSYGPKCMLKLGDGSTVLDRQINIIRNSYPDANIYVSTGFQAAKITSSNSVTYNQTYGYTYSNQIHSLIDTTEKSGLKNCFVLFGDIVFSDFQKFEPSESTIYLSSNQNSEKVGVTINNNKALYMMWSLPNTWSDICYINDELLNFFKEHHKEYNRSFLIEGINDAIEAGISIQTDHFGSDVIDIDRISDIDVANSTFNIK